MKRFDYLIIGGGMTAAAAAQGIREVDGQGSIGVISGESHPPYNRPPLTKKLWQGKPEKIIWTELPQAGVELITGRQVVRLDVERKIAQDEEGAQYGYGKLLLATGGSPRRLDFAPPETVYYRTLDDYHQVREWTGKGARFGIIGGGFIGSELAASLAMNGEQVVMVFPESSIGERIYPADLAHYVTGYFREKGVDLRPGFSLQGIRPDGARFVMTGADGTAVTVDHLIAGIGIQPNTGLAEASGIKIAAREEGGGILVDGCLRTNQPDIYAAGDVASFYNVGLGKTMRVEHADNAQSMGRAAGLNMAGRHTVYDHMPFFYSDLFDLGYEAVGELDPRLETQSDWEEPFRKGVVYYRKDGKLRGVLLWNTWDKVDAARQMIMEGDTSKEAKVR